MKVDTQDFLRLVEKSKSICFFDIESTGLKGDYNTVLVVSVKPYGEKAISFPVVQPGNDQKVVREAKEELEKYDCWVSYYGKMFDIPMLNTRLLKWHQEPINKKPHLDMYFACKSALLTGRRSQAHMLRWIGAETQKMDVSPDAWADVLANPKKHMPTMIERCESDCAGLEALYNRTKHLVRDINR